jgi:hypothetical protein
MSYRRTQRWSWFIISSMATALVAGVMVTFTGPDGIELIGAIALSGLIVMTVLFSSLTITVTETTLAWQFGPGLIRKSIARAQIASITRVRTSWWTGWGIRWMGSGWLYNVSGFDALKITMMGGKQIFLGTGDPAGLMAALSAGPRRPLP